MDMVLDLPVPQVVQMDLVQDLGHLQVDLKDMDLGLVVRKDLVRGREPPMDMVLDLEDLTDMGQDQEVRMDMLLDPEVLLEDLLQVSIRHTHNIQDMGIKAERLEDILERLEDTLEHPVAILEVILERLLE